MLDDRVKYLEEKLDKEIKYSKSLMKTVTSFMRKEQEEKEAEEEASRCSKKEETTKDMVAQSSDGVPGCSKDVRTWRK
jgi:hypothetical protein